VRRVLGFLRATVTAGFAFFGLYWIGTPFLLAALWTRRVERLYAVSHGLVGLALRVAGARIEASGLEHIPRGRACVYMANHQSNIDPPILFVTLPPRLAMMGKQQVFRIPVLGPAMRLADFVPVNREDPVAARASLEVALRTLEKGIPLLVYPEGHRSFDGRLLRFKHGVFLLAIRAGAPIVPITLEGAQHAMPKGRWEIYPCTVRVTVHPPVETRGRRPEERRQLAEQVREIIASALPPELRAAEPAAVPAGEFDDML
jgi:1-acyl-sn-glycerol-3-phosphate acyltransferase